ncbi:MAG TPA: S41 family peptidase [Candidatus Paceibacterota bacterium]
MRLIKKILFFAAALVILGIVFVGGFYVGLQMPGETKILRVFQKEPFVPLREDVDFAPFWDAWSMVETRYVDSDKVSRQDMVYGAISGLVKSIGDPYTVFFPPKENEYFQSEIKGSFEGVGMEIGLRKGTITVIAPLKETPAERAGVLAGDKIIRIDDTSTIDFTIEEAVQMIRGERGSKVKLTILRNGEDEPRIIEIVRDTINIPVISTDSPTVVGKDGPQPIAIPDDIFIIQLYNFSENSPLVFRDALRTMAQSGKRKLILDLRNNPGGFLEAAVHISSWFLPEGEIVVSEDHGREEKINHRSYGFDIFRNLPMVVLVNQGSASASEIVAGTLQDHGIAKLVGEKTFGKGSVQELLPLTENTSIKITVAKWLTPKGRDISAGGLTPDYEVKPTAKDIESARDPVLEKAIELLKNANGRL